MSLSSKLSLTSAFCVFFSMQAFADDTSLYAEVAPDDASFVRFVGFTDTATAEFAGKDFDLPKEALNAYVPVSSSLLNDVPNGSYFTVLRTGQGQSGKRGVNPLSVTLGVFADDAQTPMLTFEVSLKRGQNISFVADDRGIHLIENQFGPVAK